LSPHTINYSFTHSLKREQKEPFDGTPFLIENVEPSRVIVMATDDYTQRLVATMFLERKKLAEKRAVHYIV
jgi:hypothetical protein